MAKLLRLLALVILAGLIGANGRSHAQAKSDRRFGIDYEPDNYSQKTAKEALASVVRAIDARKVDYLLAQLADPAYVDKRVQDLDGNFRKLVNEMTDRLASDPTTLKELKRFASEGEWEEGEDSATARLKDVKTRAVFFKKIDNRWYFENRQKAEGKEK
jgi:hypothetical protein